MLILFYSPSAKPGLNEHNIFTDVLSPNKQEVQDIKIFIYGVLD